MCAACVAQGITYVGGALTTLQVMATRAKSKRSRSSIAEDSTSIPEPAATT
jgi:hypothetical protein